MISDYHQDKCKHASQHPLINQSCNVFAKHARAGKAMVEAFMHDFVTKLSQTQYLFDLLSLSSRHNFRNFIFNHVVWPSAASNSFIN